jgi:hypothetical protein
MMRERKPASLALRSTAKATDACRNVTWTVIIIGRFAGGKLIKDWVELDRLGLFQELGRFRPGREVRLNL